MKNILFTLILFVFSYTIYGQAANEAQRIYEANAGDYCGTHFDETMEARLDRNLRIMRKEGFTRNTSTWTYVPITLWLVGNDNGSNKYSKTEALTRLCELNEMYHSLNVHFYLSEDGIRDDLNNTAWNTGGSGQNGVMSWLNRTPNAVNAYIVQTAVSGTTVVCGYYTPAQDVVIVASGCFGFNSTTLQHEAGHFFSLPHTFSGWEGQNYSCGTQVAPINEHVDGTYCETEGDRFCDTGPDYLSDRWTCNGNGQSSCQHIDPAGVAFFPEGWNVMSYANDFCMTGFSNEQSTAMQVDLDQRGNLINPTFDYQAIGTNPVLSIPAEGSTNVPYDYAYLYWSAPANATSYVLEINRNSNFSNSQVVEELCLNTNEYYTSSLAPNTTYYWRVKPYNVGYTCSAWSARGTFTTNSFAVGTQEVAGLNGFEIMPNPVVTGNDIILNIEMNEAKEVDAKLFSIDGRLITSKTLNLQMGKGIYNLPLADASAGVYIVSLESEEGVNRKKILVMD